jgi:hypothetical protein
MAGAPVSAPESKVICGIKQDGKRKLWPPIIIATSRLRERTAMPNTLTARYISSVGVGLLAAFIPTSLGVAASTGQTLNPARTIKMEAIEKIERPPGESKSDPKGATPDAALVKQLQQLSDEYKAIKLKTAKYPPLKSSAPPELKQARNEMSVNMAAAEGLLKGRTNNPNAALESKIQELEKAIKRLTDIMKKIEELDKKIADLQAVFMETISRDPSASTPRRKP